MFARILAGVLAPVLIAASGYGGYAGMKAVVERVDTRYEPAADRPAADVVVSNDAFTLRLPRPAVAEPPQGFEAGGMPFPVTVWTTSDDAEPVYAVSYAEDILTGPTAADVQAELQQFIVGAAEANSGTLSGEEGFMIGPDQARRGVIDLGFGRLFVTAVGHGSTVLAIVVATSDEVAPASYAEVVASLQWLV